MGVPRYNSARFSLKIHASNIILVRRGGMRRRCSHLDRTLNSDEMKDCRAMTNIFKIKYQHICNSLHLVSAKVNNPVVLSAYVLNQAGCSQVVPEKDK